MLRVLTWYFCLWGRRLSRTADCSFLNCAAASCDDVTPLCESVSYDAWTLRCNFGWNLPPHGSIKNGHVVKEADFWEIHYNQWLFPLFLYLSFLGLKYACSTSTYGGRVRSCQLCNEDEQVRLHQKPMEISPFGWAWMSQFTVRIRLPGLRNMNQM